MALWEKEIKLLKEELKLLKDCQTQYVNLGVAASGLIFAYAVGTGSLYKQFSNPSTGIPFLDPIFVAPIFIILPIWCIVFNKATSITRIVGYYQLLEDINLYKVSTNNFIGWENSSEKLRKLGRDYEKKLKHDKGIIFWADLSFVNKIKYFFKIIGIGSTYQQYWRLIFHTFFWLSVLCFIFTFAPLLVPLNGNTIWQVLHYNKLLVAFFYTVLVFTSYIIYYNTKIYYQLSEGFHSYSANKILWTELLVNNIQINEPYEYLDKYRKYKKALYAGIFCVIFIVLLIYL